MKIATQPAWCGSFPAPKHQQFVRLCLSTRPVCTRCDSTLCGWMPLHINSEFCGQAFPPASCRTAVRIWHASVAPYPASTAAVVPCRAEKHFRVLRHSCKSFGHHFFISPPDTFLSPAKKSRRAPKPHQLNCSRAARAAGGSCRGDRNYGSIVAYCSVETVFGMCKHEWTAIHKAISSRRFAGSNAVVHGCD